MASGFDGKVFPDSRNEIVAPAGLASRRRPTTRSHTQERSNGCIENDPNNPVVVLIDPPLFERRKSEAILEIEEWILLLIE